MEKQLQETIKQQAAEKLRFMQKHGTKVPGMSLESHKPTEAPEWFDRELFTHAQSLNGTYGSILLFSHILGLITVYNVSEAVLPLLMTGNSRTIPQLFWRYLSTICIVKSWYTSDPFDPQSKAFKTLKLVRGLHRRSGDKLNDASNRGAGSRELWINQFNMMATQFTFFGYMALFPKQLGFYNFTTKDFHSLFHFWRVIGYCLGIEDRFNLCSGPDEEIYAMCNLLYQHEYRPRILAGNEKVGISMSKGIAVGLEKFTRLVNYNAFLYYAAPFMGLNRQVYAPQTFYDRVMCTIFWLYYRILTRWAIFNWLITKYLEVRLWFAIRFRKQHLKRLGKYTESYETDSRCPVSFNLPYENALTLDLY